MMTKKTAPKSNTSPHPYLPLEPTPQILNSRPVPLPVRLQASSYASQPDPTRCMHIIPNVYSVLMFHLVVSSRSTQLYTQLYPLVLFSVRSVGFVCLRVSPFYTVKALVDSGSTADIISSALVDQLKIKRIELEMPVPLNMAV
jgi:hypothetical protein